MVIITEKQNRELNKELDKLLNHMSKTYEELEKKYNIKFTGIHINGIPHNLTGYTYSK